MKLKEDIMIEDLTNEIFIITDADEYYGILKGKVCKVSDSGSTRHISTLDKSMGFNISAFRYIDVKILNPQDDPEYYL